MSDFMQWDDFRKIIAENLLPWRVVKYYRSGVGFKDTISICDFSLPRRKRMKEHSTVEGHARDWYRDSFVCNAGWLEGAIPIHTKPAVYNHESHKWEKWPARGARDVMQCLVKDGVVASTPEIKTFVRTGYWRR